MDEYVPEKESLSAALLAEVANGLARDLRAARVELDAARARVAELETELAKVKGYRWELAERCYRKDLELDELRERRNYRDLMTSEERAAVGERNRRATEQDILDAARPAETTNGE